MATQNALRLAQSNLASKKLIQDSRNYKCQKCLLIGHFTYQCTNKRTYSSRVTRSKLLDDRIEENIALSKLPEKGNNPQDETPTKKSKLVNESSVQVPKADDLSELSSQTSSDTDTDTESSDHSTDSSATSGSSGDSINETPDTTKARKLVKNVDN